MNLLRGAGLNGLAAMREVSKADLTGRLSDPSLTVTRAEILGHARVHTLGWRDDTSNASRSHFRNRLRHEAIPPSSRRSVATRGRRSSALRSSSPRTMRG